MKIIFSLFFVILTLNELQAQDFVSNLSKYSEEYKPERLYIHYDKSSYTPGETIWFKIYLMEAIMPVNKSKTVYIDWTDAKGKLIFRTVSPVVEGSTFGQFELPIDFEGQYLHVKAYTRWMLNFDSAFLYNKDIKIISGKPNKTTANPKKITEITFFPEGGDAIAGLVNKIAFKANDAFGKPVNVTGIIQNNEGEIVDSLLVMHDGMGYFYTNPKPGEKFIAKWKDEIGKEYSTPLPEVKATGVTLQVGNLGVNKTFKISNPDINAGQVPFQVIGTMYHQPVFSITKAFENGIIQGIIPTQDLPTGILTITVFDGNNKPLAERITYIKKDDHRFIPTLEVKHWGLNKRARNDIEITVPDSLVSNLSVSVTDNAIDKDTAYEIVSQLFLAEELKGKIYDPAQYFENNSDTLNKYLDLIMLTHGWRRFRWEAIAKGQLPEINFPRDSTYLTISGKIYGATPTQLRDAGDIVVLYKQGESGNQVTTIPIKSDGSFNDAQAILFDTTKLYYQLPKNKGLDDASVQFLQNKLAAPANTLSASGLFSNLQNDTTGQSRHFQLSEESLQEMKTFDAKVLETITIKGQTKSKLEIMEEKYVSGMFQTDGNSFDLINDPFAKSAFSIFSYLQGKVAGLQINTTSNPPTLNWRGGAPQLYLDEVPVDAQFVSTLSVSDVAMIKTIRPPFMGGGGNAANGAIAIYTRRGDDVVREPGSGLANNTVVGYTNIRQFYSPDYSTFEKGHEKKDLRTTIYWNPEVVTKPGNSKVLLTFYNTDVTESFRVVVEGMTSDGRLAHVEMLME